MIQTTRLESSQKVLCNIIFRDACLNPQDNEFPHRVKVTSSEYTKRFFKITTKQKWRTTKLYSFTLQLNSKFASTARGGQITNFKENCNLKKNHCLWCLAIYLGIQINVNCTVGHLTRALNDKSIPRALKTYLDINARAISWLINGSGTTLKTSNPFILATSSIQNPVKE